jgi:hypothetical protein
MWRFELPDAVVYRFRDWGRHRRGFFLGGVSAALIVAASLVPTGVRYALLGAALATAAAGAVTLYRMKHLVIDRARRLLMVEERRPFRQTLRRIFSLDCIRLRLEMATMKWGKDPYQSLWIEDQCEGRKLRLLERSSSLRCDTSRLESDLGRPLLVVVRS